MPLTRQLREGDGYALTTPDGRQIRIEFHRRGTSRSLKATFLVDDEVRIERYPCDPQSGVARGERKGGVS
jgi:hypothetical protein